MTIFHVADALELYSQALQQVTQQHVHTAGGTSGSSSEAAVLSSNIAAVLIRLDRPEESLQYATAATEVCMASQQCLHFACQPAPSSPTDCLGRLLAFLFSWLSHHH
jgi:hypothetical protein